MAFFTLVDGGLPPIGEGLVSLGGLIGIRDHPYQPAHLDTPSLLGVILAQTSSVRVFADVGDLPMRSPAVLAKAAATLDLLSGGRIKMGIGAGGFLHAARGMGAPGWTRAHSLAALEEAVAVMRAMWSGEHRGLRFEGQYYILRGVHPGPQSCTRAAVTGTLTDLRPSNPAGEKRRRASAPASRRASSPRPWSSRS